MGNRSFLYIVPSNNDNDSGEEIAEANNNFPTLWQVLLAAGDAAPAIRDQRVFGDSGTDNLAADAEPALERLHALAAFVREHPQSYKLPRLAIQFDALETHLGCLVEKWRGDEVRPVFSANLDELSWLDGERSSEQFISDCRADCDRLWSEIQDAIRCRNFPKLDDLLGLTEYGRDFSRWDAWAWSFGFSSLHHDYFNDCDEPRDIGFDEFVPEPRDYSYEHDLGDNHRRFEEGGKWGVLHEDEDGRTRIVLPAEWDDVRRAGPDGIVWLGRTDRYGLAQLYEDRAVILLEPQVENFWDFEHGIAIAQRDGKEGFLREDGSWLFEPTVDELWPFQNGYAPYRVGDREGVIDTNGAIAIDARYESVGTFNAAEITAATQNGHQGLIRADGETVLPFEYDNIEWLDEFAGFQLTCGERKGLCRSDGSAWLAAEWDDLKVLVPYRLVGVRRNDLWGVFDWQGSQRIAPQFHKIDFRYHYNLPDDEESAKLLENLRLDLMVRVGKHMGMVDDTGTVLVPIEYDEVESFESQSLEAGAELQPRDMVRIARRGKSRVRMFGAYDVALRKEAVPCQYERMFVTSMGGGEFGLLVGNDNSPAERARLGEARVGLLRSDGSTLIPLDYAWLALARPLSDLRSMDSVRNELRKRWSAGEPILAVPNQTGRFVWLHRDGRQEPYADYLAWRYAQGDFDAALTLARQLRDGEGIEKDSASARRWFALGAGISPAALSNSGVIPGPEAVQPGGICAAMYDLSFLLIDGIGGPEQPECARAWLDHALAHGRGDDRDIISQLGFMFGQGIGGDVDHVRETELYERAAKLDSTMALHNLGLNCQYGIGVEADSDKALECFRRAERLGDIGSAYHVGELLSNGADELDGKARRERLGEAAYFLRKVVDATDVTHIEDACGHLALIHLDTESADFDLARAEELLLRGAEMDSTWCMAILEEEIYGNKDCKRFDAGKAADWAARRKALEGDSP
jgi:uncharacterized protein